jgi:type VI secretion system protein ImpL
MTRFFSALRHPLFLAAIGLLLLAALIWWVGPLLSFGDRHPLDGTGERMIVLAVLVAIFALVAGIRAWRRRRTNQPHRRTAAGPSSVERECRPVATLQRGAEGAGRERAPAARRRGLAVSVPYEPPW